mgnify:CR=1 FL=1
MIAGTGSGCGKTTVTLAVLRALQRRGIELAAFKCGPDYIDPMFHKAVLGIPSRNLDLFFIDEIEIRSQLVHHIPQDGLGVIEGVMGYYDGMDATSCRQSTWEMARLTRTPVLLVVDASGSAASAAATVKGFMTLREDSGIAGVLVNRVSGAHHYELVRDAVAHYTGLPCVGYIEKHVNLALKSRHLGLVPAEEVEDALPRIQEAARQVADTLDLPMILELARRAPVLPVAPRKYPRMDGFRMGLARDKAFSFYYRANLDALEGAGVELVPFSPLEDGELPKGLDGLYLGGGFPEVFKVRLSANMSMRQSIRTALESGLPCYAECGGMMYLSESIDSAEMVGFLPQVCRMTDRLQRFGYVLVADLKTGRTYPAHEFHHAATEAAGEAAYDFEIRKASRPELCWPGGMHKGNTTAGFAHLHFLSHPEWMERLWR